MDDGVEEQVPVTPAPSVELEPIAGTQMNTTTLTQIVRNEIQHGLNPLQVQMSNLSTAVTNRLNEQDLRIARLEQVMAEEAPSQT